MKNRDGLNLLLPRVTGVKFKKDLEHNFVIY